MTARSFAVFYLFSSHTNCILFWDKKFFHKNFISILVFTQNQSGSALNSGFLYSTLGMVNWVAPTRVTLSYINTRFIYICTCLLAGNSLFIQQFFSSSFYYYTYVYSLKLQVLLMPLYLPHQWLKSSLSLCNALAGAAATFIHHLRLTPQHAGCALNATPLLLYAHIIINNYIHILWGYLNLNLEIKKKI